MVHLQIGFRLKRLIQLEIGFVRKFSSFARSNRDLAKRWIKIGWRTREIGNMAPGIEKYVHERIKNWNVFCLYFCFDGEHLWLKWHTNWTDFEPNSLSKSINEWNVHFCKFIFLILKIESSYISRYKDHCVWVYVYWSHTNAHTYTHVPSQHCRSALFTLIAVKRFLLSS